MQTIDVILQGTNQLFFSKPIEAKTPKGEEEEIKQALAKVYTDKDGVVYVPFEMIRSVISAGVTIAKMKLDGSVGRAREILKSSMFNIQPAQIPLKPKTTINDLVVERYPTIVDGGKLKWIRLAGTKDHKWSLDFRIIHADIFDTVVAGTDNYYLHEALSNAGMLCRIGGRRSRGYGSFMVEKYRKVKS